MKTWLPRWSIVLFGLLLSSILNAQWIPCSGIDGAYTQSLVTLDSTLFVCSGNNGIYARKVTGGAWEQKLPTTFFWDIMRCGNALFAYTEWSCFRSLDHGNTWQSMHQYWGVSSTYSLCAVDTVLFFASYQSVYSSFDNGSTIFLINNNLPPLNTPIVSASEGTLFCYSDYDSYQIFQSQDLGNTWDSIPTAGLPTTWHVTGDICKFGGDIWDATSAGIYKYNNLQENWVLVKDSVMFRHLEAINGVLYANSKDQGFFRLDAGSNQWIPENNSLETLDVEGFCNFDNQLFLATDVGPYTAGTNYAWQPFYDGLNQTEVRKVFTHNNEVWVTTAKYLYRSVDEGAHFVKHDLNGIAVPTQLIMTDSVFYMIAADSFYISNDHGNTWNLHNSGLPYSTQYPYLHLNSLAVNNDFIFLGTDMGLFRSTHNNYTWTKLLSLGTAGLLALDLVEQDTVLLVIKSLYTSDYHYYVFRSTNNGLSFDSVSGLPSTYFPLIEADQNNLYALVFKQLYKSGDGGSSWISLPINDPDFRGYCLAVKAPAIIVGGTKLGPTQFGTCLAVTYDDGLTWTDIRENLPVPAWPYINLAEVNQMRTFASPLQNGLWYQDNVLAGLSKISPLPASKINVAPNPAQGFATLHVDLAEACTAKVMVADMMGNISFAGQIRRFEKGKTTEQLDLRSLAPGLYIVSFHSEKTTLHFKLQIIDQQNK